MGCLECSEDKFLNHERIANVKAFVKGWQESDDHSLEYTGFTGITNTTGMIENMEEGADP
jgi:hypothetical protein